MKDDMKENRFGNLKVMKSELKPMRKLIEERGANVTNKTFRFIQEIEREAYPEMMQCLQSAKELYDLPEVYGYLMSQITIARNIDWYIVYAEDENYIDIIDVASKIDRDKEASRKEIHDYLIEVINKKAIEGNKIIKGNAKEDTSYKMIQRMVKNGEYEIMKDEANNWKYDDSIKMHNLILKPVKQNELSKEL